MHAWLEQHCRADTQRQRLQGWARQYAQHGVRVNSVLPAWVRTDYTDHLAQNLGVRALMHTQWCCTACHASSYSEEILGVHLHGRHFAIT